MNSKQVCQRCHRELKEQETSTSERENTLCHRCQDMLEFGYPSFPFYKLSEYATK